jgi:hexosaminidase
LPVPFLLCCLVINLFIFNFIIGHAASWCTGYPDICPAPTCLQPLDPSSNQTFPLITSLLAECTGADVSSSTATAAATAAPYTYTPKSKRAVAPTTAHAPHPHPHRTTTPSAAQQAAALFPYSLLHLGGDEVSYTCWDQSADVQQWETDNGIENGSEGTYEYFVDRVATIARDQGRTPVQWVEVFEHFGRYCL